ncbi:putative O-methyltransferase [Xylariales sp. PMI_506]|nr:putative O-methyltransferase [Xylariales sp. PMI_506]
MANRTQEIIESLNEVKAEDFASDEAARTQAVDAARKLLHRLQLPTERLLELTVSSPFILAAAQTFQDLGLWGAWAADGGEKSVQDLLKLANANVDINLLRRLSRLLAVDGFIEEVSEERYKPTILSLDIASQGSPWIQVATDHGSATAHSFPLFLKNTSYRVPADPENTAYRFSNPEKLEFWPRCETNPALQTSFTGMMASWSRYKVPWPLFFDTDRLLQGFNVETPLLVDVGGNIGNDLGSFLEQHPGVPAGSLILQDRPEALAHAKVDSKIRVMPHNFFEPQPVIGSRAYFFHAVFHDWGDEKALEILRQLAPAMKRGYSKLLICDIMLPTTKATHIQATLDVQMMGLISALERTEPMWESLLEQAGFNVVKLWSDPRGYETLIEAELA